MDRQNGQVVFITGASSGIGKACAHHLQQRGYRVYGTGRQVQPPVPGADDEPPGGVRMIRMDVESDGSVTQAIDLIMEREERLDVVVNSAGFALAGSVEDTTIAEAKHQFEVNFFGVLRVCRAVLPIMRQQGSGIIVNISSIAGLIATPFQGFYCASKFALEGMSEALRMEARSHGIRVVLIEPGDFQTQFTANRRIALAARENPAYAGPFERALDVVQADETHGPGPQRIAYLLEHIITSRSPRLRYTIGPATERVAITLKKIMPSRLFEWAIMKYYGLL